MVLREIVVTPRVRSTPCLQVKILPVGGSANSGLSIVTYHNFHLNPSIKRDRNLGCVFLSTGLESQEYGHRDPSRWPHGTLYPQKLSLTSTTSGGRSVGIVRSRTQATEFIYFFQHRLLLRSCQWTKRAIVTSKCDNEKICLRNLLIDRRIWFKRILNSTIFSDITLYSPLKVNRRSACHLLSRYFLLRIILRPWRRRRQVTSKHQLTLNILQVVVPQKTKLFITTPVGTSNPTNWTFVL
jgi:hypothetical protein